MQAFEPMPLELSTEAEMEIVRDSIAKTMTVIYQLKLKERYYVRQVLGNKSLQTTLGQTQAQIKAEGDYLSMLRETEKELNTKILNGQKKFTGKAEPEHNGPGHGVYPDPDWQEERKA